MQGMRRTILGALGSVWFWFSCYVVALVFLLMPMPTSSAGQDCDRLACLDECFAICSSVSSTTTVTTSTTTTTLYGACCSFPSVIETLRSCVGSPLYLDGMCEFWGGQLGAVNTVCDRHVEAGCIPADQGHDDHDACCELEGQTPEYNICWSLHYRFGGTIETSGAAQSCRDANGEIYLGHCRPSGMCSGADYE